MIRFIYNLLWPLALVFFLPGYLVKMFRRGGYREKFGQRLGNYDAHLRARLYWKKSIWLHAVSVGEVTIALKLARQIRILKPDVHCVLTTTTTTGFAFANQNAPDWIEVMYSPLDFWPIMRRAFAAIRPTAIILVEAEGTARPSVSWHRAVGAFRKRYRAACPAWRVMPGEEARVRPECRAPDRGHTRNDRAGPARAPAPPPVANAPSASPSPRPPATAGAAMAAAKKKEAVPKRPPAAHAAAPVQLEPAPGAPAPAASND